MSLAVHVLPAMFLCSLMATPGGAQELSPRAYWPAPNGTKVVVLGYSYSTGDIVTDPTLPVVGVDSKVNVGVVGYGHTFNLAGRTANLLVQLPVSWGTTVGEVEGVPQRRDVSGLADFGARLAVNLVGAPTMSGDDFQTLRQNPRPVLGVSLEVKAPTGDYEADKVINIGTNRWAIKPEDGFVNPLRPTWLLEFALGAWLFGDNDDFLGQLRKQEAVVVSELHLIKRLKPGFWASFDLNFFTGGRNFLAGEPTETLQRNSRLGATLMFPFKRGHAIKAGYSTGFVTRTGGNWNRFVLSYLYAWN
jgi:hypothetical protein